MLVVEAIQWGHSPQPGLALLRLAQGRVDAAQAAIRRVVDEAGNIVTLSKVLPAHVEIMLATGDVKAARAAAAELSEIGREFDAPYLRAVAAYAKGAVLLADGEARTALDALRDAWTVWHELEAPYEAARARFLIGVACWELGDQDTGKMELDAARQVFQGLGAASDLARLDAMAVRAGSIDTHGPTVRELQVLRLVASGKTNKLIADKLFLSERTVDRHVSNIFTKLGLSSRAAATAYAYEHELV